MFVAHYSCIARTCGCIIYTVICAQRARRCIYREAEEWVTAGVMTGTSLTETTSRSISRRAVAKYNCGAVSAVGWVSAMGGVRAFILGRPILGKAK